MPAYHKKNGKVRTQTIDPHTVTEELEGNAHCDDGIPAKLLHRERNHELYDALVPERLHVC